MRSPAERRQKIVLQPCADVRRLRSAGCRVDTDTYGSPPQCEQDTSEPLSILALFRELERRKHEGGRDAQTLIVADWSSG